MYQGEVAHTKYGVPYTYEPHMLFWSTRNIFTLQRTVLVYKTPKRLTTLHVEKNFSE